MLLRCLTCVLIGLVIFQPQGSLHAQVDQVLEEIQTLPSGFMGEWKIGEKTYVVDSSSRLQTSYAESGNVAAVQFVERDGQLKVLQLATFPVKAAEQNDGPHVIWEDATTAKVLMMRDGIVETKTYENITEPRKIDDFPNLPFEVWLDPSVPETPKTTWETPSKILAISDLEGHFDNVIPFLQSNGVIDQNLNWAWDDGHLVLVGDLVDRGEKVTELMTFLRTLERQSAAAGGQMHYVLGNHEVMVMAGDLRYVNVKYHFICQRYGVTYDQLYGTDSDIGRWWRSKNAVMQIGDLLFVHAGYSPQLDEAQLEMDSLNQLLRDGIPPSTNMEETLSKNPAAHKLGPLWYRGYFARHADEFGGLATTDQITAILERHQAKHVVIGHTVVDHVGAIPGTDGLVIGIDLKWESKDKGAGLLIEDGKMFSVDMNGQRTELPR